ncbi:MAG: hypothetical protein WD533_08850 [Dehalococcoidia bacterium]
MTDATFRWILDQGLPRARHASSDVAHAEDFARVPGPCGIREAIVLDRTLVTCDQEFRGPWALPLEHPGIVVLDDCPTDAAEIERNLRNLEFRLHQHGDAIQLAGNRFVVKPTGEVLRVLPDGTETDMASWRQVRIERGAALAGSPAFS